MRLEFHPEAEAELGEAARHYEGVQAGLGLRFFTCVEAALRRVVEAPERWPAIDGEVRRCLVRVFPFAVLYARIGDRLLVLAVMHCHRRPGYWRNRRGQG